MPRSRTSSMVTNVVLFADQLKELDSVNGYGVVQRTNGFHVPGCGHKCHNSCDPVSRVVVRFFGQEQPYVFAGTTEFQVERPEPEPEYNPAYMQDEERL